MTHLELHRDAYPELLVGALRDEIRHEERRQQAADAARRRRRERWARLVRHLTSRAE
jgi:hypothetical protein